MIVGADQDVECQYKIFDERKGKECKSDLDQETISFTNVLPQSIGDRRVDDPLYRSERI